MSKSDGYFVKTGDVPEACIAAGAKFSLGRRSPGITPQQRHIFYNGSRGPSEFSRP